MKIYKIKVNGKSYRVELEAIEQIDTVPLEEKKKQETKKIVNTTGALEVPLQSKVKLLTSKLNQATKCKRVTF